jgi:multiple sugar transport system substrate-binding protein
MHRTPFRSVGSQHFTRRGLLRRSAALAGGLAAAAGPSLLRGHASAVAQGLSGKIVVSFEDPTNLLSPQVATAAKALRDANPDAEIEIEKSAGGNFATQLILSLTRGSGPDVFVINGLGIGELAAGGFVEPLDGYLAAWDGWAQYSDTVRSALTFQDHIWALNWSMDVNFLYYRKDIFAEAGLPVDWNPATLDEIPAAAREIKAKAPNTIPYALFAGANGGNATASRAFLPLLYAYGGTMQDEQGKWIIDSCPIRQTLAYYETVYQVDETVPQQVMTDVSPETEMHDAFENGELAILFDGSWAAGPWFQDDPEGAAERIGYVLHPTATGEPPFTIGGVGNCWYIYTGSENKDLAWAFISQMNTKDAQMALNTVDPHVPARTDAATDPAFQSSQFMTDMVEAATSARISPPAPAYRQLIGIVQNATGIVATGEVDAEGAVERYASELTRVLGEANVAAQPCS